MESNTTEITDQTVDTTNANVNVNPEVTNELTSTTSDVSAEPVYPHQALIAEKNIDVKQLPKEIMNQIKSFKLTVGRYNKSKSQKDLDSMKKSSIVMAHDIQSWLEKDLPDTTVVVEPVVEKKAEEPVIPQTVGDNNNNEVKPLDNATEENGKKEEVQGDGEKNGADDSDEKDKDDVEFYVPPRVFKRPEPRPRFIRKPVELTQEQKVLNALDSDGKIDHDDFCDILGVKSLKFSVTLGNTIFDNEPMTNFYRVRK